MKEKLTRIDSDLELDLSRADRFVSPAECVRDQYGRKLDGNGDPIGPKYDPTEGQDLYGPPSSALPPRNA